MDTPTAQAMGHDTLIVYPPALPYGYTLHHRFQRVWEVADYVRREHPSLGVVDAGLLNTLQGDVLRRIDGRVRLVIFYVEPQLLEVTGALVRRLRLMWPELRIAMYGPALTTYPADVLELEPDAVGMRGDFEQQLVEIVNWVFEGTAPSVHSAIRTADGWTTPHGDFRFLTAAEWGWPPLNEMPQDDIARIYEYKNEPRTMAVTVARGCPFLCSFCSTPQVEGRAERRREVHDLVDYIASYPQFTTWQMYAPNFTLNRRWVLQFCKELIERDLKIRWKCTTRSDRIDAEMAEAMAAAGCIAVGLGVETVGLTRDAIRKGENLDVVSTAITELVSRGIKVKGYVLLGLPGQTLEEARATVDFVTSLGAIPRPTLYSPQGEADELVQSGLVDAPTSSSGIDRKSYVPENSDGYGELLRLIYHP